MGIFKILFGGIADSNKKFKVVIYLWGINVLYSLAVILPVFFWLHNDVSRSLMGDSLRNGLDMMWVIDIMSRLMDGLGSVLGIWMMVPAVLFFLLHIFLNGGILGRLKDKDAPVTAADFFRDCGAYFGRFFRLFLLSIPVYIILVGIPLGAFSSLFDLFTKHAGSAVPRIIFANIKTLLFLLFFAVANMFLDYVKIRLVVTDGRKVWKETLWTLRFVLGRFFKAWGLYLLIGVLNIVGVFIYLEIANLLPGSSMFLVLLVFIWQQLYIIWKVWMKQNFFAAQMLLYRSEEQPAV